MKKFFTILGGIFFLSTFISAQIVLEMNSLPGDDSLRTVGQIIYFKTVIKDTSETNPINLGLCLSKDTIKAWGDYTCQLRIANAYFDARDQGGTGNYMAIDTLNWEVDKFYHVWLEVYFSGDEVTPGTYNVIIQPDGDATQYNIAIDAHFRNNVQVLKWWTDLGQNSPGAGGYIEVSNVAFVNDYSIPTGINNIAQRNSILNCNPNPVKDALTVNYSLRNSANMNLSIFDITGKEVLVLYKGYKNAGQHQLKANISSLQQGLYIARLQTGSTIEIQKLIIK